MKNGNTLSTLEARLTDARRALDEARAQIRTPAAAAHREKIADARQAAREAQSASAAAWDDARRAAETAEEVRSMLGQSYDGQNVITRADVRRADDRAKTLAAVAVDRAEYACKMSDALSAARAEAVEQIEYRRAAADVKRLESTLAALSAPTADARTKAKRRLADDLPTLLAAVCLGGRSLDDLAISASAAVVNAAAKKLARLGYHTTSEPETYGRSLDDMTARNTAAAARMLERSDEHPRGRLPADGRVTDLLSVAYIQIRELGAALGDRAAEPAAWAEVLPFISSDGKTHRGRAVGIVITRVANAAAYKWSRGADARMTLTDMSGLRTAADAAAYAQFSREQSTGERWMTADEQQAVAACIRRDLKDAPYEVFTRLAGGQTQSEIADALGRNRSTISTHAARVHAVGRDAIREVLPRERADALIRARSTAEG